MILKELRSRGVAQRVLAIVPPNLIHQWLFEMKSKFNESFAVLNTNTVRYLRNQGYEGNPFMHPDYPSVLCSSRWVATEIIAKLCVDVDWDLVIIDEAHHARSHPDGSTTRLYRLTRDLALAEHVARRGMLLLTATPMQLNTHELYSLVEILDPTLFPSPENFENHRKAVPGLSRLVERLCQYGFPLPDENPDRTVDQVAEWLNINPAEAHVRLSEIKDNHTKREALAKDLGDKYRLSEVLIRNRKAVMGGFKPRKASRWKVDLTQEERAAQQAVNDYVQYGYQLAEGGNNAIGFVMVICQKLMASSIAAIRESLGKRHEKILAKITDQQSSDDIDDRIDDDEDAGDVIASTGIAIDDCREIWLLEQAIAALDKVGFDSKAKVLIEKLSDLFSDCPGKKVIVFTQYKETQRYLVEKMKAQGWSVSIFHGQMAAKEKDDAIARFKDENGTQILVSTEAGGEGRNLQFCHVMINHDLPWNPMKVEQRIGRIDRIGQKHPIKIINLWVKDTIEGRVLDMLERRIQVFEETVGGLDPILGDAENDIKKIMRISDDRREAALSEFGERIEKDIHAARKAGNLLGDFIMDTKSYSKEITTRIIGKRSPINNDDFERFIGQLLADVRTYIKKKNGVYQLTYHGSFFDSTDNNLFPKGDKVKAVFRPDSRPDADDIDFMAFGHKVIDAIVKQVLHEEYEGVTGTRRIFADDEFSPASGWLFTYQFTTPGMRTVEKVVPIFVSDSGEVDVELGRRLLQRALRFDSAETEISPHEIPSNLDMIESLANQFASAKRDEIQRKAESDSMERVDRGVSRLNELFDYKERGAKDKVTATQATVDRMRESGSDSDRQILPAWEANLRRDTALCNELAYERRRRIADAEKYRYPQVDWALKSLGRIEIVPTELK